MAEEGQRPRRGFGAIMARAFGRGSAASSEDARTPAPVDAETQLAQGLERFKREAEDALAAIGRARSEAVDAAESAAERADASATKAAAQIEAASQELGVRARRQELRLVREETSKRMTGALARLERQAELRAAEVEAVRAESRGLLNQIEERTRSAEEAAGELERRLQATGRRLSSAETSAESSAALIEDAMARLDGAIARVEATERHLLAVAERAESAARDITRLAEQAERAVDWEGRIAAATRTEAHAAQRITEAERRLLDRVDPGAHRG